MNIGMILLGTSFPPDIRVEKEAAVLCRAGYSVSLLTESKTDFYEEDSVYIPGLKIIKKPVDHDIKTNKNIIFKCNRFFRLIKEEYLEIIKDFILTENPDILHVHDFKILPTVFFCIEKNQQR